MLLVLLLRLHEVSLVDVGAYLGHHLQLVMGQLRPRGLARDSLLRLRGLSLLLEQLGLEKIVLIVPSQEGFVESCAGLHPKLWVRLLELVHSLQEVVALGVLLLQIVLIVH